jgi:hypothetical protein
MPRMMKRVSHLLAIELDLGPGPSGRCLLLSPGLPSCICRMVLLLALRRVEYSVDRAAV